MAESVVASGRDVWRDYLDICKPRVVLLMLLCAIVGMFLATPGMVPVDVLIFGTLGIALVAGSAAAVNHIADATSNTISSDCTSKAASLAFNRNS